MEQFGFIRAPMFLLALGLFWPALVLGDVSPGTQPPVSNTDLAEYCQWEKFNASCPEDSVIVMTHAQYGRMRFGRCMKEDHGSNGCAADVLPHLDRQCSGRRRCVLTIPDAALHGTHPCPKELMPYLEASYKCVKVETTSQHMCEIFGAHKLPAGGGGYLASGETTAHSAAGTPRCPWLIQTERGKKINLTLLNFDITPPPDDHENQVLPCKVYVHVQESNASAATRVPVCRDSKRTRGVYVSQTSEVKVWVKHSESWRTETSFLLHYSDIGCADVAPIPHAEVKRKGDTTIIKCNFTGETFFLSCSDNQWIGEHHNCSKVVPLEASHTVDKMVKFPYGLLIVICIGVALGVALGIVMLAGILLCLKRRKEEKLRSATQDPLLSETPIDSEDAHSNYYERRGDIIIGHGSLGRGTMRSRGKFQIYQDAAELKQQAMSQNGGGGHQHIPPPSHYPIPPPYNAYATYEGMLIKRHFINTNQSHPDITESSICSCGRPVHEHDESEMQTSFITFKPDAATKSMESLSGHQQQQQRNHHQNVEARASVDLVKDSEPYRELNPENLLLECTCSLRQGKHTVQSHYPPPPSPHSIENDNGTVDSDRTEVTHHAGPLVDTGGYNVEGERSPETDTLPQPVC